eukprot:227833-Chlamydomonas_euryale.AAC.7
MEKLRGVQFVGDGHSQGEFGTPGSASLVPRPLCCTLSCRVNTTSAAERTPIKSPPCARPHNHQPSKCCCSSASPGPSLTFLPVAVSHISKGLGIWAEHGVGSCRWIAGVTCGCRRVG